MEKKAYITPYAKMVRAELEPFCKGSVYPYGESLSIDNMPDGDGYGETTYVEGEGDVIFNSGKGNLFNDDAIW